MGSGKKTSPASERGAAGVGAGRFRWLLSAGVVLVAAGLWVSRVGCLTVVSGASMEPTLASGDLLWVDRRAYAEASPTRGDLVVAVHRGEWIVKRVVGLPGETVEVRGGRVWVDGREALMGHPLLAGPLQIRPGRLFRGRFALLGDNRSESSETLVHAVVSKDALVGRVRWRLSPRHLVFGWLGGGSI